MFIIAVPFSYVEVSPIVELAFDWGRRHITYDPMHIISMELPCLGAGIEDGLIRPGGFLSKSKSAPCAPTIIPRVYFALIIKIVNLRSHKFVL